MQATIFSKSRVRREASLAALMLGLMPVTALAAEAQAVSPDAESDIIVTGTRRAERSILKSNVPVDVVSAGDLQTVPSSDLSDKIAQTVPSFNVQRLPSYDGASFVRPATLRGLSPDQTLVLVNGKRRHRSAYVNIQQQGAQAVDLAQIPQIALGRVEVLRDGASAQYGSDAIAGVINLILDETVGYRATAQVGQYYEGDGETVELSARAGLALADRGVLSISGEYAHGNETDRGDAEQKIGQPKLESYKAFATLKYALADDVELYGFGNYSYVRGRQQFSYRSPAGSIYNRSFFQNSVPALYPDYSLKDKYPNGFIPIFGSNSKDYSVNAGLRGNLAEGLTYDLSGRFGRNRIDYSLKNSINASLGPLSPTEFDTGSWVQTEYGANADFVWLLDAGLAQPVNVSFGGEWRREKFALHAGDESAYVVGPLSDLTPGSNGYPSPTPEQAGSWGRNSYAAYLDVDVDLTDRLNFAVAGRHEHFSDFGSTWNYKASARFEAADWISLRGAISTGFHAPTPGQQNLTNTTQGPDPLNPPPAPQVILTNGLIPSTNPIAMTRGGKRLEAEKSKNYSIGLVLTPAPRVSLSVDYYRIDIDGRLGITSTLTLTAAERAALLAAGVSQAGSLSTFRFFINGYDTRTQGVDVVGRYTLPLGPDKLDFTLAYNYGKSKITSGDPRIVNDNLYAEVERRRPKNTAILSATYTHGPFSVLGRARYYSSFTDAVSYLPASTHDRIGAEAFFDLALSYAVTPRATITVGAENIGDNYPDRITGVLSQYGIRYPSLRPYEADGGRYYARISTSF